MKWEIGPILRHATLVSSRRSGNKMKFRRQVHLSVSRPPATLVLFLVPRQIGLHNIGYILGCEHQARRTLVPSLLLPVCRVAAAPFAILGRHRRKIRTGSSSP